jgi:hypothetical protein
MQSLSLTTKTNYKFGKKEAQFVWVYRTSNFETDFQLHESFKPPNKKETTLYKKTEKPSLKITTMKKRNNKTKNRERERERYVNFVQYSLFSCLTWVNKPRTQNKKKEKTNV